MVKHNNLRICKCL